jgi:hypothetical protein
MRNRIPVRRFTERDRVLARLNQHVAFGTYEPNWTLELGGTS